MVGLRVPARMLRKIDKFADALSKDRSSTLRFLLEAGIEAKAYFLRRGRGSRMADRVVRAVVAKEKAKGAELAAERATDTDKVAAEIKAQRASEHAEELASSARDRFALAETQRALTTAPTEASSRDQASSTYRPRRHRQHLTEAEIKAAADRAQALSKHRD
jgi:hypothetical protein